MPNGRAHLLCGKAHVGSACTSQLGRLCALYLTYLTSRSLLSFSQTYFSGSWYCHDHVATTDTTFQACALGTNYS